jgi:hypothetical protein
VTGVLESTLGSPDGIEDVPLAFSGEIGMVSRGTGDDAWFATEVILILWIRSLEWVWFEQSAEALEAEGEGDGSGKGRRVRC